MVMFLTTISAMARAARLIYNNEEAAMLSDVPTKTENWTFTLEDGSTVTKAVYVG